MKKAMNVRLEEHIILTLEKLSQDMHTTKTDVIEKAIQLFSKQNSKKNNNLLQFAGTLGANEANGMLETIEMNSSSKEFRVDL